MGGNQEYDYKIGDRLRQCGDIEIKIARVGMPCQGSNDRQEDDRQSRHRHSGLHSLIPADDSDRHNIQDPKTNLPASPEIIDRDAYHQNERGEQILDNNALSSSIHNAETESGPPVFEISSHPPANQDETNWKDTPNALRSKST